MKLKLTLGVVALTLGLSQVALADEYCGKGSNMSNGKCVHSLVCPKGTIASPGLGKCLSKRQNRELSRKSKWHRSSWNPSNWHSSHKHKSHKH